MPKNIDAKGVKGEQFILLDPGSTINKAGVKMGNPKTWGSVKSKQQQSNQYNQIILRLMDELATQTKKGIEVKRS